MAGDPKAVTVRRVAWSKRVAAHLALIRYWPPNLSLVWFRQEIECERIIVLGIFAGKVQVASAFYAVDNGGEVPEFVIYGAGGRLKGGDLVATVYPVLQGIAEGMGCRSVRLETARPGLGRKMVKMGFRPAGVVMRKVLV